MPANPHFFDTDVFCEPGSDKAHGVVLQFPDGMSTEKCNDILRRMFKAGYCKGVRRDFRDPNSVEAPTCNSFNPDHGSPVWYIP